MHFCSFASIIFRTPIFVPAQSNLPEGMRAQKSKQELDDIGSSIYTHPESLENLVYPHNDATKGSLCAATTGVNPVFLSSFSLLTSRSNFL